MTIAPPNIGVLRLADIRRLSYDFSADGEARNPKQWLPVVANAILVADRIHPPRNDDGAYERMLDWCVKKLVTHSRRLGFELPIETIESIMENALQWAIKMAQETGRSFNLLISADKAAKKLGVTLERRRRTRAWTIGAIDLDKIEREAARRKQKRKNEKDRRRSGGVKPRAKWLASCVSQTRPWEAFGVSRRTWYRMGQPDPTPNNLDNPVFQRKRRPNSPPRTVKGRPRNNCQAEVEMANTNDASYDTGTPSMAQVCGLHYTGVA